MASEILTPEAIDCHRRIDADQDPARVARVEYIALLDSHEALREQLLNSHEDLRKERKTNAAWKDIYDEALRRIAELEVRNEKLTEERDQARRIAEDYLSDMDRDDAYAVELWSRKEVR